MTDPNAPLIAGGGQITDHGSNGSAPSSFSLMVEAVRRAAADAGDGGESLLAAADSVAVVNCLTWPARDPGAILAAELGLSPRETVYTSISGNSPIALLTDLCRRIQAGELDVALLVGAEAVQAGMAGGALPAAPEEAAEATPTRTVGVDRPANHPREMAAGLYAPIQYYPLFENALRHADGQGVEEHRRRLGTLWGRFAEVARANPHAWDADPPDANSIGTVGERNREVSLPYLKWMNANIRVNQGAALLLCSTGAADRAGIDPGRRVFVHSAATAQDHWFVGEREALDRSPALAACGRAVLAHAGVGIDDVAHLDLYSCFPSAVQIAARELGIDLESDTRSPTVTGGLTFAGGPGNNYVTHALAALTDRLREDPGSTGLSTAVGWYMTKHGVAVLSTREPEQPFAAPEVQDRIDALPSRTIAEDAQGEGTVESYTVMYDRSGTPEAGIVAALLPNGDRAFARSEDAKTIVSLLDADPLGDPVQVSAPSFQL